MLAKKEGKIEYGGGEEDKTPNTITMTRSNIVEKKKKKKGVKWKWSFAQQKKKRAYNCIT